MTNYLFQPQADHTADPTNLTNAVFAFGVADPGTVSGLTNGTAYVAREFVLSPASAAFTPVAILFLDDFSTDTSADYTKNAGDAALVVSGGVASSDGVGNTNILVIRNVGVNANHKVRITVDNASDILSILGKVTDSGNEVRGVWDPDPGIFRLEKRVSGTYTNFGNTETVQSFSSGDILELEIFNNGDSATLRKSTDGGATFIDIEVTPANGIDPSTTVVDVSDVPVGPSIGFRLIGAATITELSADNT